MDLTFSVIIPTYNGEKFLRKTLVALRGSTVKPLKTIVVDDFSSDGTLEMLQKEFPEVTAIRNNKNLGPTVSRNRGAKLTGGKYILFLDNDVLVKPTAIQSLLKFLGNYPDSGMAGGKLITTQGKPMWWNFGFRKVKVLGEPIGFLLSLIGLRHLSLRFSLNYWDYDRALEVGWIAEGFFAIPRELFEKVGRFDEGFFMAFEGADLSERLRQVGYKTYFCSEAEAEILESHTHDASRRGKWFLHGRNLYYKKHFGGATLWQKLGGWARVILIKLR